MLIFVFLALIDRTDLRDRFLRLMGGNVHRSTESIEEAGARVSKYLLMQIAVNVSYGIPLALGLWIIGVPGALLWACLAAALRFVPYLGPMIGAIFPIVLAFAVDPAWTMVLWTIALIVFLELISNNVVEPLLYGARHWALGYLPDCVGHVLDGHVGPCRFDPVDANRCVPLGLRAQYSAAAVPRHPARLDAGTRSSNAHLPATDCRRSGRGD